MCGCLRAGAILVINLVGLIDLLFFAAIASKGLITLS